MYILKIHKDGVVGYGLEPWKDSRNRTRIEFQEPRSIMLVPYTYETASEAEMYGKAWQHSNPAEAEGWSLEVEYYGR